MKLGFHKAARVGGFHPPCPDPTYAYIIYTESCMKRNVITIFRESKRTEWSDYVTAATSAVGLRCLHRWNSLKISYRNNVNLIYQEHNHINMSFIYPKFTVGCYAEWSWLTEDWYCGNNMNPFFSWTLPFTVYILFKKALSGLWQRSSPTVRIPHLCLPR